MKTDRVDALISACAAFPFVLDGDVEIVEKALVDEAERFLRAGGSLSLTDWSALSEISRRALAEAGDRIRFAVAGLIGAAGLSTDHALAIAEGGEVDPDALRIRLALEKATKRAAERISG